MAIDADSYMEGNIPSLSRGGSWLPASHQMNNGSSSPLSPLHPGSVHGSSPLTAMFPRTPPGPYGGSIAPGPLVRSPGMPMSPGSMGGSMYSGKPMLRHLHGGMAASTAIHGLKRDHAVSPKSHTGWLRAGSEADDRSMPGSAYGGRSFDGRSLVSGAHSVSSSSSYHTRQYSHHHFDEHLPAERGRSWEKNEGAPRLITREKDYGLRKDPPVKVDGRLRRSSEVGGVTTPYRKLEGHQVQQGAEDYFSRGHTPSQGVLSPKPSRRKASDPDLHRSAQLNSRLARMSLQGRECRTPDPEPSVGKRPTMSRRHTSHPHSSGESSQAPSSLPLSPPVHKQLNQIKRTRHNSTPPPPSSTTTSFQDKASDVDFTLQPAPAPRSRASSRSGSVAPTSVSRQFPKPHVGTPYKPPVSAKGSMGYIPPLADDPYDRYASHPSTPTPDYVEKQLASSALSPSSSSTSRLRPPQPKAEKAGEYTPPGFPKATKDFPWNRDGPAMKTYGIAWCRDGEADQLPLGPEGPRWTQARPPRADHTMGGGWWESGGEGSAV
ncbi:hypothetical protein B9479_006483 [Cryptococcus floricola]|uniref:Uncharacterized protein n=1 Tax=Cryptococcus floricola TaxID=2591691 RepID=A0A5D3AN94_9TREE|nr:hypothetical protein B9479_006483 [Cryptococcus floricola]